MQAVVASGTVEGARVEGTFTEADVPQGHLGLKHGEPRQAVMPFFDHHRIKPSCQVHFAHPFFEHGRNPLLENAPVHLAGAFHQVQLVGAFDGPNGGQGRINRPNVADRKVLLKALQ